MCSTDLIRCECTISSGEKSKLEFSFTNFFLRFVTIESPSGERSVSIGTATSDDIEPNWLRDGNDFNRNRFLTASIDSLLSTLLMDS